MLDLSDRITVDPKQCGGRPCIRGMRIRVSDILDLKANGLSPEQIIDEMADIEACLRFRQSTFGCVHRFGHLLRTGVQ